jgi:hypothetical protein
MQAARYQAERPIHNATLQSHAQMLEILLQSGAQVDQTTSVGKTAVRHVTSLFRLPRLRSAASHLQSATLTGTISSALANMAVRCE